MEEESKPFFEFPVHLDLLFDRDPKVEFVEVELESEHEMPHCAQLSGDEDCTRERRTDFYYEPIAPEELEVV